MSNCDITIEFLQPKPIVFEFKTDGSAQQTNPVIEQRLSDLEEATDGLHLGVDPLTYYILARDN